MNLIGYGLAKFDRAFAREFGCESKSAFAALLVQVGLASSARSVFNRQDSFDPYFDNGRRGWYQRNQREHIKLFIDSLFGNENVNGFANITKLYINELSSDSSFTLPTVSPTTRSKFKQLQETGKEAEIYFINHYQDIPLFTRATLEDARLWGDGYDFQLQIEDHFLLAEVKGVRQPVGAIRLTQKEYDKANEYGDDFCLVVVSRLASSPKLNCIPNPLTQISFQCRQTNVTSNDYCSNALNW